MSTRGTATAEKVPDYLRELEAVLPLTMTLQAAAKHMCVHPKTLMRWIETGDIRATRAAGKGSSRLILTRSEVIRWFSAHPSR
jgi:excisionase family DNA binding protein